MRFADINKLYTDTISEYIARGYHFNTATMSGMQDEITKADLTDGNELIRVLIRRNRKYSRYDGYEIFVGRADAPGKLIDSEDTWYTVWNNRLAEVSSTVFYRASSDLADKNADWFVSEEQLKKNHDKMSERTKRRFEFDIHQTVGNRITSDKAKSIAINYVRRQPRCKSAKVTDIVVYKEDGKFRIGYKDKLWTLK